MGLRDLKDGKLERYYDRADKKVQFYLSEYELKSLMEMCKEDERTISYMCRRIVAKVVREWKEKKEKEK